MYVGNCNWLTWCQVHLVTRKAANDLAPNNKLNTDMIWSWYIPTAYGQIFQLKQIDTHKILIIFDE